MSEAETISRVKQPNTVATLTRDLRALGLAEGSVVIVHSSLSAIGWTAGGPQAVVEALLTAVGERGTIVMPTHTTQYSDPAGWQAPAVPESWIEIIRRERPAFHPALTPTRGMGAVVECFRTHPRAKRSLHPLYSFAAAGPLADEMTRQSLDDSMGEHSPLAHLYARDALVLLLGVDHGNNTSLHLAEYRSGVPAKREYYDLFVQVDAPPPGREGRRCVHFSDRELDSEGFAFIGAEWEKQASDNDLTVAHVGAVASRLLRQRPVVDYAAKRLPELRST